MKWLLLGFLCGGVATATYATDPVFLDVSANNGIGTYNAASGMGGGIAAADYDNDGDIDLFVPTAEGTPHQLYRNLTNDGGAVLFEEIAAQVGLASLTRGRSAAWLDADGDGRLDLLVAGDCFQTDCVSGTSMLQFYRQTETGTFVDATRERGLFQDGSQLQPWQHRGGVSAGDIDNDGDPDLLSTIWLGGIQIYINRGDGRFTDISASLGQLAEPMQGVGPWQGLFHDFNRDGSQDIFVAVDFSENYLLLRQAWGGFSEVGVTSGVSRPWNGMGTSLGDMDNDGDLDLFVTNISDNFDGELRHSTLYENQSSQGTVSFAEVSQARGLDNIDWGWGVTWLDADNDGWLDIAATNGFVNRVDTSRFFFNQKTPGAVFREASATVGFNDSEWGSGLIAIDVDRDGDLDLMQSCMDGPLRLLTNQQPNNGHHYLVIRPRRQGAFPFPLGTLIRVKTGSMTQTRLITAGTSFMSQEPAEAFFGLGTATTADEVVVLWPKGGRSVLDNVAADQLLTVTDANRCFNQEDQGLRLAGWPHTHRVTALIEAFDDVCPPPAAAKPRNQP